MVLRVSVQLARTPERVQTYCTQVWLISSVVTPVNGQVSGLGKPLAARLTGVRPLTRVKSVVYDHVAGRGEALGTHRAPVRTLAGVFSEV